MARQKQAAQAAEVPAEETEEVQAEDEGAEPGEGVAVSTNYEVEDLNASAEQVSDPYKGQPEVEVHEAGSGITVETFL